MGLLLVSLNVTTAQQPLATPRPLQPGIPLATGRPLNTPQPYQPPTLRPTITPTPLWREVYYVQGYTPLWAVPARAYTVPFSLVAPGWYLMVENRGYWFVILNCSRTRQFQVPCPWESLWVQYDGNLMRVY